MQLHEREKLVRQAGLALSQKIGEWYEEYGEKLTLGEELKVLQKELGTSIQQIAKHMIRHERHGDGDKPGGLA